MPRDVAGVPDRNLKIFHLTVDRILRDTPDPTRIPALLKLMEARERKLRAERVNGLLVILADRSIRLKKTHERRLRGMAFGKLPPYELALQATSAGEFANLAGLTRAR